MDNKLIYGILGAVLVLAGFGGSLILTQDELDNAFYCTATEEVGIFYGGISGTAYTAYPYEENRTDYKRCKLDGNKGIWINLKDYAKEKGVPILDILQKSLEPNPIENQISKGKSYLCSPIKCEVIN